MTWSDNRSPILSHKGSHCSDYTIAAEMLPRLVEIDQLPTGSCSRMLAMSNFLRLFFGVNHDEEPLYDFAVCYISAAHVFLRVHWFDTVEGFVAALGSRFNGAIPHDRPFDPQIADDDETGARIVAAVTKAQQSTLKQHERALAASLDRDRAHAAAGEAGASIKH